MLNQKSIKYNWHEADVSMMEGVFARGDRRLSKALLEANKMGVMFDSWDEYFSYDKWCEVFDASGIDPDFYANRTFGFDEILPWDHIDCGVTKQYLLRERAKAYEEKTTPSCAEHCNGCGANKLGGKNRWCN